MAVRFELVDQKSVACCSIRQEPAASTGTRSVHSQLRMGSVVGCDWVGRQRSQRTFCTLSATGPLRLHSPCRQPDPASYWHPSRGRRDRRSRVPRTPSLESARPFPCTAAAVPRPAHTPASWGSAQTSPAAVGSRGGFFPDRFAPAAGPVPTQIGAPAAPDLLGRSFRYPENTAQQRARRYRLNAAGCAPLR